MIGLIPPPNYVCRLCQQPGHYIQHCPLAIPSSGDQQQSRHHHRSDQQMYNQQHQQPHRDAYRRR